MFDRNYIYEKNFTNVLNVKKEIFGVFILNIFILQGKTLNTRFKHVQDLDISFIIPTYNEAKNIANTLNNIIKYTPSEFRYEIIVADNGSRDDTRDIVEEYNISLVFNDLVTVGGLRNLAVRRAKGHILIFIDADVLLTEEWKKHIHKAVQSLKRDPLQITGSKCGMPDDSGWLENFWFKPLIERKVKYINSGHLITTRELFDRINGFDESLETGEDYAFSQAAKALNAKIVNNPELLVWHKGYPKTLGQFMKREIWHGVGEGKTLRTIKTSNVAMISILFAGLHGVFMVGILVMGNLTVSIGGGGLIYGLCLFSAIYKHRVKTIPTMMIVSFLYYIYFACRFLACVPFLNLWLTAKHHR